MNGVRPWWVCLAVALVVLLAGCGDPELTETQDKLKDALTEIAEVPELNLVSDGVDLVCGAGLGVACTDVEASLFYNTLPTDRETCDAAVAVQGMIPTTGFVDAGLTPIGRAGGSEPEITPGSKVEDASAEQLLSLCMRAADLGRSFITFAALDLDTPRATYGRVVVYFDREEPPAWQDHTRVLFGD